MLTDKISLVRSAATRALTSLAQRIEGVYLTKGTVTGSDGQIITETKPVTQKQRPLITLTAVTFEVITESSQQTFE